MELQKNILVPVTVLMFYCEVVSPSPASYRAVIGSAVTLPCGPSKLPRLLELSSLTLEWNMVDARGHKRTLYVFEDGQARVDRDRAEVDQTRLLLRDASLRLHNVSVEDEGLYTCRVITPVVYTVSARLQVSARPFVWLPDSAAVARGGEKIVVCDVQGYYPSKVSVSWLLQNGSQTLQTSRLYRVCTEMPVHNADGTFSLRSAITVTSSALEQGQMQLLCQVEHQTFSSPFRKSVALTQAVSEHKDAVMLMAGSSVASVLLVLSAVGAVFLLLRYSRRKAMLNVPPVVSEILQPSVTHADVEHVLKCMISGAGPGEFQVRWSRLCGDSADSEATSLLPWDDLSEQACLESDGGHHTSVLSLCLSTREDRSRFRCEVHWNGQTFTREATVYVKVEPSFLQISSIPQIPRVEHLLVLCCRVENFYPSEVYLDWFRNDGEQVDPPTHYGPFSDHSHLFSVWSKIQLTMAPEDESATYTCRVYHSSLSAPGYRDVHYHINTQGTPPNVMFIDCDPLQPVLNTECTLHLCITDFCPKHVAVTWTVDGECVDSSRVFCTPPSLNTNGLYSMYSFLKVWPTLAQGSCRYFCRVEHSAQGQPEERSFTLTPQLCAESDPSSAS